MLVGYTVLGIPFLMLEMIHSMSPEYGIQWEYVLVGFQRVEVWNKELMIMSWLGYSKLKAFHFVHRTCLFCMKLIIYLQWSSIPFITILNYNNVFGLYCVRSHLVEIIFVGESIQNILMYESIIRNLTSAKGILRMFSGFP